MMGVNVTPPNGRAPQLFTQISEIPSQMFIQPMQGQWLWRSRTNACLQVHSVPWHVCAHYITVTSWRVCSTESCDFLSTSQEPPLCWSDHDFCHEKFPACNTVCILILFAAWYLEDVTAEKGVKTHLRFPCFTASIPSLALQVFGCDSVHISAFFMSHQILAPLPPPLYSLLKPLWALFSDITTVSISRQSGLLCE